MALPSSVRKDSRWLPARGTRGRRERGADARPVSRTAPRGQSSALVVFPAHGQVDKGEDVKLDHDGEAQEDGVEDQHVDTQLPVQSPFVEVDAQDLAGERARAGLGAERYVQKAFGLGNDTQTRTPNSPHSVGWSRGVLPGIAWL